MGPSRFDRDRPHRQAEDGKVSADYAKGSTRALGIHFKPGSEWPLPGFVMGISQFKFVYDAGAAPTGSPWNGACVTAEDGEKVIAGEAACAASGNQLGRPGMVR